MHLVVDAAGAKFGGAATVLLEVVRAALEEPHVTHLSVFTSPRELRRFELPVSQKLSEIPIRGVEESRFQRLLWSLYKMGNQCIQIGADTVLCLGNMGYAPIPYVVFVQQSLPFSSEALSKLGLRQRAEMIVIREMMRYSCRSATHVLVQTPVMVKNLQRYFGIEDHRVSYHIPSAHLASNDLNESNQILRQFDAVVQGRRLLYVGTDAAYKMLDTVINGMALLRTRIPDVTLFMTLPVDHPYSKIPGVVCCGYLSGTALRLAYQMATLVVMPSLTETVGLPLIEAFSVGTPAVAADRPYAHVISGDAAVYFNPHSAEEFADVTAHVLQDSSLHAQLSHAALSLAKERALEQPYARMINTVVQCASM